MYMPLQIHKRTHKGSLPKFQLLHVYTHSKTTQTQRVIANIPSLTCVHAIYNNTSINTKAHCQNDQFYVRTYPLNQYNHEHKVWFPKFPVLHAYIHSTITQA